MSPLPVAVNTVIIPNGTWVPVMVRLVANCYIQLLYFLLCLQCFDAVDWVAGRASSL